MDLSEAMIKRHSVRAFTEEKIADSAVAALKEIIEECNKESGLHFQLVTEEPLAFGGLMAKYGNFSGVKNYIALIGKKGADLEEKTGYYGAKVMLFAQTLGLNSCWVALTYKKVKSAYEIREGEKLCGVIAIGYGKTQGVPHKNKPKETLISDGGYAAVPEWFARGAEAAMLAPTATNQQRFLISYEGENKVKAVAKSGFYSRTDLGIVKYFFETGAGKENFVWTE